MAPACFLGCFSTGGSCQGHLWIMCCSLAWARRFCVCLSVSPRPSWKPAWARLAGCGVFLPALLLLLALGCCGSGHMLEVDQGAKRPSFNLCSAAVPNKSGFTAFWLLTAVVLAHPEEMKLVFALVQTFTGFSLCQIDCMGSSYPML